MSAADQLLRENGLRYVVESLVSLALAVMLVRTFAVEGYIISTGSMAPFLLGYHKQVVCPNCHAPFAVGVPVELDHPTDGPVGCPNCQQDQIDLARVPRNEGDQLLVQKFAYLVRKPKRWEVVVFQNPSHPTQAYVKRAIGLPNESLQIIAGDIWINGELVRKTLDEQRSTRIPVDAQRHHADDETTSRWQGDSSWKMQSNGFHLSDEQDSFAWVNYRGPRKRASSSRENSPTVAWPLDEYGYNGLTEPPQMHRVRDLMLSAEVEIHSGRGDFALSVTDGIQLFEVRLAASRREWQFFCDEQEIPASTVGLSGSIWRRPMRVELSSFDRQILFAIDGQTIFVQKLAARTNDGDSGLAANGGTPVRMGARDLNVSIRDLTLFRDVYYTSGDARHGVYEPYPLGSDEFFFLGDNSPVSLDSRSWPEAIVREHNLIGKPFMVHLPSRPGRIKLGSTEWHIRVPDWGRIRYIR